MRTWSIRETILMQEAQISGSFGRCTHASSSSSPKPLHLLARDGLVAVCLHSWQ